jgi:lactoylglutathione lyase
LCASTLGSLHGSLPAHDVPDHRPGQESRVLRGARLRSRRELPIVRDGELEATNYFLGIPGQEEELELTFNHAGRTYDMGTAYGHIALAVDDLDETLERLKEQGIEPEREPYGVREGGSRLCFVRDPDDYRLELIERPDSREPG